MQKIKLELDALEVQSFATSPVESANGTIVAHEGTKNGPNCGSAYDACQTGLCTGDCQPTYSPDACPTDYPQYC